MTRMFVALLGLFFVSVSSFEARAESDAVLLKNFREIYAAYQQIMQIEGSGDIKETYLAVKDRLPRSGRPDELASPVVMAATELSGAFCKAAITKEKALPRGQRTLYGDIDFTRGPVQFTDFLRDRLCDHFSGLFWGRNMMPAERAVLADLLTKLSTQANTPAATEQALQALCTTYATSLSFLTK